MRRSRGIALLPGAWAAAAGLCLAADPVDFSMDPLPAAQPRQTLFSAVASREADLGWGEGDLFLVAPFEIAPGLRPGWIDAPTLDTTSRFARLEIPLRAHPGGADLAVTVYYHDLASGFIRLYWSGDAHAMTLCENLFEGVDLPNQRTVLLERPEIGGGGVLVFQASGPELAVEAIHFSWVQPALVLAPRYVRAPALVLDERRALDAGSISGEAPVSRPDHWRGPILSALLAEGPERVERGVTFVGELGAAPGRALVRVQVLGLSPVEDLVLWVNGERAGRVSVEVPPLADPSYVEDEAGTPLYQGWLRGGVFLRPGLVRAGENTFEFTTENAAGISDGLAVKDLRLEIMYPEEAARAGDASD